MVAALQKLPWGMVILGCLTLGLAPFAPEPHVVEKLRMLADGTLTKPIDLFDLLFHGSPWLLLIARAGAAAMPAAPEPPRPG